MGPLMPLFWTSGDVSSEFQNQSGFPHLLAKIYVAFITSSPMDIPSLMSSTESHDPLMIITI